MSPQPNIAPSAEEATYLRANPGNYFEGHVQIFKEGGVISHGTSITITDGDVRIYNSLFGQRYTTTLDNEFAKELGFKRGAPIPWGLMLHMCFGKTVPDISKLAVANMAYSDMRFLKQVYPGDTIVAETKIIGYKENFEKDGVTPKGTGNTYVHSIIYCVKDGKREPVMEFKRLVMINKRDVHSKPAQGLGLPEKVIPDMPKMVDQSVLMQIASSYPDMSAANNNPENIKRSGSPMGWEQYHAGMRINHGERREIKPNHDQLPNLTQNDAQIHFAEGRVSEDSSVEGTGIVYGGNIISMADAQRFYGFENTVGIVAINSGAHTNRCFAGESISSWSEVLETMEVPGRSDIGLLRIRTVAAKNMPAGSFPDKQEEKTPYPLQPTKITIGGRKHAADKGIVLDMETVIAVRRNLAGSALNLRPVVSPAPVAA